MFRGIEEKKIEQKGFKIMGILIMQYLLCFAGMGYSIAISNINILMVFGVIMVFNAALQFRALKYIKEQKKF